jgi:polyferredoxin
MPCLREWWHRLRACAPTRKIVSRLSRPARWRIVALALVHLLIAVHLLHWRLNGRSLSSIQLSDAGRFAAEGVATAAFVFFTVLLLLTAVFGRLFCAWGCHMLAFQEVCRWLLGRIGIRPKLIRSRVLWIVPFAAAFHVFVQPVVERAWRGDAFPEARLELASDNVWAGLPGTGVGIIAFLVCGLGMVYLLGSLSFCKYICPYGALFAVADRLALGRIRLTGECDGCARCTAACTTGVRVHEEVQRFATVANPGCMRCFECVSACPRRVLAYRLGVPSLRPGLRTPSSFSFAEEALLLATGAATFWALNGLYDAVPLFLSVSASVVVGYVAVLSGRVVRCPFVTLRGVTLKVAGRLSAAGAVFAVAVAGVAVLLGHSMLIQYHQQRAEAALGRLGFPRLTPPSEAERRLAREAATDLRFCTRWGLVDSSDWHMKLAWLGRALADSEAIEQHLRHAIAIAPRLPAAHFNLGRELARQGRRGEAAQAFATAVRLRPDLAQWVPAGMDVGGLHAAVAR